MLSMTMGPTGIYADHANNVIDYSFIDSSFGLRDRLTFRGRLPVERHQTAIHLQDRDPDWSSPAGIQTMSPAMKEIEQLTGGEDNARRTSRITVEYRQRRVMDENENIRPIKGGHGAATDGLVAMINAMTGRWYTRINSQSTSSAGCGRCCKGRELNLRSSKIGFASQEISTDPPALCGGFFRAKISHRPSRRQEGCRIGNGAFNVFACNRVVAETLASCPISL